MIKVMSGGGRHRWSCPVVLVLSFLVMTSLFVSAENEEKGEVSISREEAAPKSFYSGNLFDFLYQKGQLGYTHTRVWPKMEFGWKIVVGSIIGFLGAAFGSVGGVGGGGIFVPMLTLIIGFDAKSSTAISKCMIMGGAGATVYYNLRLRHPTLDMPIIDYDLALLFQPMLVLGISIGVSLNVIFAYWMITILLILLFIFMSTKAFFKGLETWKKETIMKKEAARRLESNGNGVPEVEYKTGTEEPRHGNGGEVKEAKAKEVSILENVHWKEFGLLCAVWVIILGLQIGKNYTDTCSAGYWVLDLMQLPVTVGVSAYEAVSLYKGRRVIASKGEQGTEWKVHKLILYCCCGMLAGIVGGLLGLGGGFILGPLFLELGIPPQVSSATATFAMMFSSSMSVVEYYLLKRFPVPYALYFFGVAIIAALAGQHVVRRVIDMLGRASLIIFILAFTIFVSAISLGGVGVEKMVEKIHKRQYMGFENLCTYDPS